MAVLGDAQLKQFVEAGLLRHHDDKGRLTGLNVNHLDASIRSASVNLTVGRVFVPDTRNSDSGSLGRGRASYDLPPGGTAIVETQQWITMPTNLTGIVFPRPGFAARGVLMTNPGHVDPGYRGPLHFTVINMGKEPLALERSPEDGHDLLANMMVMEVIDCGKDWLARKSGGAARTIEGDLERARTLSRNALEDAYSALTSDFLSVEKRARKAARRQIALDTTKSATVLAILFLVITIVGMEITFSRGSGSVNDLDKRVTRLEEKDMPASQPSATGTRGPGSAPTPSATMHP